MTQIIDGKAIAQHIFDGLKSTISTMDNAPTLAIILANDLDASSIYVRRKIKKCEEIGIKPVLHKLDKTVTTNDVLELVKTLNNDEETNGIFLQLPAYDHLNENEIIQSIKPEKDIDGLTAINIGKVVANDDSGLTPCTPQGVMTMLNHHNIDLTGKHVVIIGRSILFGKPMGQLLLNANCTVTQCHSKTVDLPSFTKQADILIAAVGQPEMVKADWIKDNAIVIDVGINRKDNGKITGDVDFENVKNKASLITPVPGGVGPMTVASLMVNVVRACNI